MVKERGWKFILEGVPVWALALPLLELLGRLSVLSLEPVYYLPYFASVFLTGLLISAFGKRELLYRLLLVFPIAVGLISRDGVLLVNCFAALLVFVIIDMLYSVSWSKWVLPVLLIALLILWVPREDMPRYVAGCLILATAAIGSLYLRGVQRNRWAVLLLFTVLIASFLPVKDEPMKWDRVKKFAQNAGEYIDRTWKNIKYAIDGLTGGDETGYVGYSETGGLAGGLSGSDREELYFHTNGKKKPVYLTGAVYAKLGPNGFTERVEENLPVNAWLAMYLSALTNGGVSKSKAYCFSRVTGADITYAYIRTSDLLLPSTTFRIAGNLKYGLEKKAKKGFTYDFNFMLLDSASPYFIELAGEAEGFDAPVSYEDAAATAKDVYTIRLKEYLTEDEYYEGIRAYENVKDNPDYLDTSMVTDRMRELAQSLTENCATDMEKALVVEEFIRQYPYDKSVDLRGRENYVDSYLFEEQRGYCMHAASAMVCLLRAVGVPARYVQGYLYNPSDDGVVRGSNAHAWVEAYMEGLGWVRFEPTGGVRNASAYTWGLVLPKEQEEAEEEENEEDLPLTTEEIVVPDLPEVLPTPTPQKFENGTHLRKILVTAGIYLLAIIGSAVLILALYFLIKKVAYLKLTPEKRLQADIQNLRKKLDKNLPEGTVCESVFDYLSYVEENLREQLTPIFTEYYRVRFRGDAVPDDLFDKVRAAMKA